MKVLPLAAVLVMGPTYAGCLRAMNAAVRQGMEFDVPPGIRAVCWSGSGNAGSPHQHGRTFTSQAVNVDMKKSMRKGARIGRPPKELPPFFMKRPNDGLLGNSPAGVRPVLRRAAEIIPRMGGDTSLRRVAAAAEMSGKRFKTLVDGKVSWAVVRPPRCAVWRIRPSSKRRG